MAYEFWTAAIEGKGPEVSDVPQEGFYRIRKGKAWIPVALWWRGETDDSGELAEDAKLVCVVGFADSPQEYDPNTIWDQRSANQNSIWLACAKHPVTEERYRQAFDTGRWHDDAPEAPRGIGDNLPDDPVEQIKVELEGEAEIIDEFLKQPVTTQEQADQVGPWVDRLRKTAQRADKLREEEKRPHLSACREIDDRWRFPVARAKELAQKLKDHLLPFLQAEERARKEAARIAAEQERKLRDQAAKEQSAAKREEIEHQAAEAAKQTVVENASAGRVGAKVSLRRDKDAEITDYDALLQALKDRTEIKELVATLAKRAAKAGVELPGMKIIEITKAA